MFIVGVLLLQIDIDEICGESQNRSGDRQIGSAFRGVRLLILYPAEIHNFSVELDKHINNP